MAAEFPVMTELATAIFARRGSMVGKGCDDQFEFEFGLDLILDGLERAHLSGATGARPSRG